MRHLSTQQIPVWTIGLGLVICSCHLLGWRFPDYFWSTHYLVFVPMPLLFGGSSLVLIGLMIWRPNFYSTLIKKIHTPFPKWLVLLLLSAFVGFLIWLFPIVHDFYGEAYVLNEHLYKDVPSIPEGTNDAFFHFGLAPWDGQRTILAIVTYLAYFGETNYQDAFQKLDAVCGFGFVFIWLWSINIYLKKRGWKIIMSLAVVSGPFMLNFFGHIEINAPVLLAHSAFLLAPLLYVEHGKKSRFLVLVLLYLVCLKLHPIALLYAPALVLLSIYRFAKGRKWSNQIQSWKSLWLFVVAPIFIAGMVLYFFIFEDHMDPRQLQDKAMEYDRVFLPLFSPDPPLDRYNLLSFHHIFDYWAEWLLWSPIALLLILGLGFGLRKSINWSSIDVKLTGLTLLLMISFFFVINPLLTMQVDWDLMCMPVPAFLVFTMVLVKQEETVVVPQKVLGVALAMAVLNIPFFIVNLSEESLSKHYVSLGKRIHGTYYEWAAINIERGLSIGNDSPERIVERRQRVIDDLRPKALKGVDGEFARILLNQGREINRKLKRPEEAIPILREALTYDTANPNIHLILMETHFTVGEFTDAYDLSLHLIKEQHPNAFRAQSIALNCALEADMMDKALVHAMKCLEIEPNDEFMQSIASLLEAGRYDEARFAFP